MSYTLLPKVPKQIAKPRKKDNIVAEKVVSQSKLLCPNAFEDTTDIGYIPFYSIQSIQAANYDRSAFIQDDLNVNASTGTGLQANNLVDLKLDFINIYNLEIPDSDNDSNVDYFTQNYKVTDLAAERVEEGINQAFANLSDSLDLLNANRVYFGHDFQVTKYGTTTSVTAHFNGLADIFSSASADDPTYIDQVADLDVWGYSSSQPGHRHFDLTQGSTSSVVITPLKVFATLNTIDFKLSQPNSIFASGNTSSIAFLSQGNDAKNLKWVIWASKYYEIKAFNYALYKNLEEYYSTGKLIILEEGSLNVEKINRTSTDTGLAQPLTISPATINLPRNAIGMFSADDWYRGSYELGDLSEEVLTVNNLTKTLRKLQVCKFTTYLPNGPVAIVQVPSLLEDSGTIPG